MASSLRIERLLQAKARRQKGFSSYVDFWLKGETIYDISHNWKPGDCPSAEQRLGPLGKI